jgi:hypothetical protein
MGVSRKEIRRLKAFGHKDSVLQAEAQHGLRVFVFSEKVFDGAEEITELSAIARRQKNAQNTRIIESEV